MSNAIKYWRNKRNMIQQKLADLIGIDKPKARRRRISKN